MKSLKGLKVGLVCQPSLSYAGGIQEHVTALARYLRRRRVRVKIIAPRTRLKEAYGAGVNLLGGGLNFAGPLGTRTTLSFADSAALENYLDREKFDLLHLHNPFTPFLPWQLIERFSGPMVGTFHADLQSEESRLFPGFQDFLNRAIASRLVRYIAVSRVARQALWPKYWSRTVIIPNGIDTERFSPRRRVIARWRDRHCNIIYVGRLDERKGVVYLLEAFKKLQVRCRRPLRLLLIGEGVLRQVLREKVAREKIREVVFLGFVSRQELPHYYASANVFCSPAIYGESFGIVLLEAMASGKPVVAFANQGYQEVLTGRGAQFLVPVKDVEGLTEKLAALVEDEKLRREMGEWGVREAQKYTWNKVGERVLKVYEEALGGT